MSKKESRIIRHKRVRRKINGSALRPRLSVYRSLNHIVAQIIDDSEGQTLLSISTLDHRVKSKVNGMAKIEKVGLVGTLLAEEALSNGIEHVVFDRGGYKYHGRVKALAEAVRKAGLEI